MDHMSARQVKREKKSKGYAKNAAIEAAVAKVKNKMPGPITATLGGIFVKLHMKHQLSKRY